jgi:hypothetical protein
MFPDIYFVIAGFISQGTVIDGKMLRAAEMVTADSTTPMLEPPPFLRDVDLSSTGLPCILVHELVHFQQHAATYAWGDTHEKELRQLFAVEMNGTDFSKWLYNGNSVKDRPSQLGYWMGYQIAEAYYNKASDKSRAIIDLLNIEDYKEILVKSGCGTAEK